MGDLTEHFNRKEFACRDNCGADTISPRLVNTLETARGILGRPIRITSGLRCAAANAACGGTPESAHLAGLAADIACPTSYDRYDVLVAVLTAGFCRVGIGGDFVHVDIDKTKPQDICWLY